jgi:hypothetical protein
LDLEHRNIILKIHIYGAEPCFRWSREKM